MTTEMTPELLNMLTKEQQAAWERCQKATPGPWEYDATPSCWPAVIDGNSKTGALLMSADSLNVSESQNQANATFAAHARQDLPAALLELAQTKAALVEQAEETAAITREAYVPAVIGWTDCPNCHQAHDALADCPKPEAPKACSCGAGSLSSWKCKCLDGTGRAQ